MFINLVYILATIFLLASNSLVFEKKIENYLTITGLTLLCLHSILHCINTIRENNKKQVRIASSYNQI